MPLIKNGALVADRFVHVVDDGDLPAQGAVLVSASRCLADPQALLARGEVGVVWPNHRNIEELALYAGKLALIALHFPAFRDGRAYSQARILREHLHYKGELRATGQVLRDQFVFLARAGFDALDVKKEADAHAYADVMRRYSVFYQPTGDGRMTAFKARKRFAASAGFQKESLGS